MRSPSPGGIDRLPEQLVILGASVRAAADSARLGGYEPYSVDLFQDRDLCGPGERVARYPAGFWLALRRAPQAAWLYTGGLENYPRLIERGAAVCPLLGTAPPALRRVRDPLWLQDFCRAHRVRFPATLAPGTPRPPAGRWLLKRRRSSGGLGVHRPSPDGTAGAPSGCYWQREIEPLPGTADAFLSLGAVFLAGRDRCPLLCITRQQLIDDVQGRRPFLYAGSLGPWPVAPALQAEIERVGALLACEAPLAGVFGIDVVVRGDDVWLVEVNPRLPASAELWDRQTGQSVVAAHVAACRGDEGTLAELTAAPVGAASVGVAPEHGIHGKRIVYANAPARTADAAFSQELLSWAAAAAPPQVADIPWPGVRIEPGQPLTTVFASGPTLEATERRLTQLAAQVAQRWAEVAYG